MRVLIVRLGSMGDVIHALPALAALRQAYPSAHIGWAIERRWTPLLVAEETPLAGPRSPQRPLVDVVHVVNTLAWRKAPFSDETWSEVRNTFRTIRAERYDVAIDFQGAIKSAVVARLSGAPMRIGFAQPRERQATMFYTSPVMTPARHVIDQNLSLVSALPGVFRNRQSSIDSRQFSFAADVFPFDVAATSAIQERIAALDRFAILAPGSGWGAKQWPAARYGEVARALANDGVMPMVNHSRAEEALAREVEEASGGAAKPIFCTLPELIALTRRAALFIGGDTGPMHLANALGVPVVALFGPTDPARTGPYPPEEIRSQKTERFSKSAIVDRQSAIVLRHPSSITDRRHRPDPDPGLLEISVDEVVNAARALLSRPPTAGSREPAPDTRHLTPETRPPAAGSRKPNA